MAFGFFKIFKGTNLQPVTGSNTTAEGDLAYRDDLKKLELHDGTTSDLVVLEAKAATLTNKTISGSSNTITNIPNGSTSATSANTPSTIVSRDGSGNFAAGTITAALSGNASTATLAAAATVAHSVDGVVPIAFGGTGQSTKAPAFDALSPMTTAGDLIYGGVSGTGTRLPGGVDNQVLKYVGGTPTWSTFSNNGINYISGNPDAESGLAGWATYLDAPGVSPVNGTGGTSTLTFARSTSSPLRGTGSFLVTQPNSTNVQGNGVSYDFTIDSADKAKPLVVSFDYNASVDFTASSGQTGSESDIEVYLYDITNASLIPISPKVLVSKGANNFEFKGEFQTSSNSSSYRLILHCATTNAPSTGFQLKFDNVFVGPQANAQGAPVTDFTSFNLFIDGATPPTRGTVDYELAQTRRVGDCLEFTWDYKQNGSGSNGSAGAYLLTLPYGLNINTNKLMPDTNGFNAACGTADIFDGSNQFLGSTVKAYDNTHVAIYTPSGFFNSALSAFGNNTLQIGLKCLVPIAGWSSTVQMSQDTDTRVVAANASLSTTTSVTAGTVTPWNVLAYDTHSSFNAGRYTAPVSGIYTASGNYLNNSASTNLFLYVNGVSYRELGYLNSNLPTSYTADVKLMSGDIIDIRPETTINVNGGAGSSNFEVKRLSGPATIAASETVAFKVMSDAASATFSGSPEAVLFPDFGTDGFDTHSGYSTSTGIYTVPVSGVYDFNATLSISANYIAGSINELYIYKNGTPIAKTRGTAWSTLSAEIQPIVNCLTRVIAGDMIQIYLMVNGPSSSIAATELKSYFEGNKVGN